MGRVQRLRPLRGLLDFDGKGLGDGMAGGVAGGESVSGCFGGRYVDTAGVGRPDGIRLRLEGDLFGVGDAVAKLRGLAAADLRIAIKGLNGEFGAAHLFDGFLILLVLLLRGCVVVALFDLAIFIPARKEDPTDVEGDNENHEAGVHERIFPERFLGRRRVHRSLVHFLGRIEPGNIPPGDQMDLIVAK